MLLKYTPQPTPLTSSFERCGPTELMGSLVCSYPSSLFLLPNKRIKAGSSWLDHSTNTGIMSSFTPTKFARHCLDLELFDRLVSRVPFRTMSTDSVRTLLHWHRHRALLFSVPNHRRATDCVSHSLCHCCGKWQSTHILYDIYTVRRSWIEHNRCSDRTV